MNKLLLFLGLFFSVFCVMGMSERSFKREFAKKNPGLKESKIYTKGAGKIPTDPRIYSVDLGNEVALKDFSLFDNLPYLRALEMRVFPKMDLSFLKKHKIKNMKLYMRGYCDISVIQKMSHLDKLEIFGYWGKDVAYLKGTNLSCLRLKACSQLESIMPIAGQNKLTELVFPEKLVTVESLKMLKSLGALKSINDEAPGIFFMKFNGKELPREKKQKKAAPPTKNITLTKAEKRAIKAELKVEFDDIKNALALIEKPDKGVGSGFIAKDFDGSVYLYSNQHVIQGTNSLKVKTLGNRQLKPVKFEVSEDRDIVRFKLDPKQQYPEALGFAESASNEEPIAVFGNSGGAGVFTTLYGRIVGVGPDRIEVNAEFIPGNSGSPIIDDKKQVVGIATYMTKQNEKGDWTVEGTRFAEIRRFAYRVDPQMKWRPFKWKKYQSYAKIIEEDKKYMTDVFDLTVSWLNSPYDEIIMEYKDADLMRWMANHNRLAKKIQKAIAPGNMKANKKDAINKTAKSYTKKSTDGMTNICRKKAKSIRSRIKYSNKTLTTYLRKEMEQNAEIYDAMAKGIEKYGAMLQKKDAVQYKERELPLLF